MKAKPAASLPTGEEWLYELKLDGYRFLATKGGETVHLWSRTENDLSARFPRIAEAVRALPCDTAILDGELIVPDERGCLREQEFVIGGFTAPKGTRSHFGALIVGYFRKRDLIFAGKVGTGFDEATLAKLHEQMIARRIGTCPFFGRWGAHFTRAELASCTWIEPSLVAQVRFAERTEDGILRQPAFLGLRNDKAAREVVRET